MDNDIIVDEMSKEYMYSGCRFCGFAEFQIAVGINPRYGFYVQTCTNLGKCTPEMQNAGTPQLSLFNE